MSLFIQLKGILNMGHAEMCSSFSNSWEKGTFGCTSRWHSVAKTILTYRKEKNLYLTIERSFEITYISLDFDN